MDYEKAYKEALEKAREIRFEEDRDNIVDVDEMLDTMFPELRESEDERIRKAILGLTYIDGIEPILTKCSITAQDIRAYLEKQKENPKSADSISADCASNAKCEDRWQKVKDFLPNSGRDVLAKDALGNYLLASYDGDQWFISGYDSDDKPIVYTPAIVAWCDIPSEKQKEHQNNSDAPKKTLGRALTSPLCKDMNLDEIAQDYVDGVKEYNPEPTWNLMQTAVCYGYHYREMEEQKPVQTENEKEYIRTTKSIIADFIRDKQPEDVVFYQKIYDWLDGRHIEQKPALIAENDNWYICIKDFYAGGKKWASVGDLVQAKNGMYMMGRDDISEWFRRAYYEDVRDAFGPNTDTNIPEKPAEWSDTNELVFKDICKHLKEEGYNGWIVLLEALHSGEFKQPVSEWSEKDEAVYTAFTCEVVNEKMNPTLEQIKWLRGVRDRLKSLRPQPQQEWSEEDSKRYVSIGTTLETSVVLSKEDYDANMEWLRNLVNSVKYHSPQTKDCADCSKHLEGYISGRSDAENKLLEMYGILLMPDGELRMKPRWKPSEEQMEALKECGECKRCIKELYEQLKNL